MINYYVLLILVLRTTGSTVDEDNSQQLIIHHEGRPEGVMNPVDELLSRHPLTVAEEFTDLLMKDMKRIRHHCEEREVEVERETNVMARNLSEYQQHLMIVIETDYTNITDENRQLIQNSFARAFNNLFKEEQDKEAQISMNCSREFEQIVKQKMQAAIEYSKGLLDKSTDEFIKLLDDVSKYNMELEQARDECMKEYSAVNVIDNNPLMKGSPSYECKQIEVQILSQFVHEFVIRSASLLGENGGNISHMIVSTLTNQIPEIFPRPPPPEPVIELHPITEQSTEEIPEEMPTEEAPTVYTPTYIPDGQSDNDHTPSKPGHHHGNHNHHGDHNHHGNHHGGHNHHGNHNRTRPGNHHHGDHIHNHHGNRNRTHPGNHHHGNHHHGNHHHGNHHHGSNERPNPSHPIVMTRPQSPPSIVFDQNIFQLSEKATPTSEPVIFDDFDNSDDMYLILVAICGTVGLLLLILMMVITVIIVKCYRKYNRKNWSKLTEDQKVVQMKQSGYINPTYEFFDKVTNQ